MRDYYVTTLSGVRLRQCYTLAPPRVRQYLTAELEFVADRLLPDHRVLELGCGYGRVLHRLAERARYTLGIDTSRESLRLARQSIAPGATCDLCQMNAGDLGIRDGQFDVVVCIQNGLAVFGVDPVPVTREAIRVTRPGGRVLFSSYTAGFWEYRLEWFRIQAKHRLVGEIDYARTGNGVIACRDGFRARAVLPEDFQKMAAICQVEYRLTEVDASSLMCEMVAPERRHTPPTIGTRTERSK
jgi:SAM-dependent methyltransferase